MSLVLVMGVVSGRIKFKISSERIKCIIIYLQYLEPTQAEHLCCSVTITMSAGPGSHYTDDGLSSAGWVAQGRAPPSLWIST